jgi:hypothetical protein
LRRRRSNAVAPALETAVAAVLGKRSDGWFEFLIDPMTNSPVLLFRFIAFFSG